MNKFLAFFTGLFAAMSSLFHSDRKWMNKVYDHNETAKAMLRERLRPFAQRFILPMRVRDENGILQPTEDTIYWDDMVADKKRIRNRKRGMKDFVTEDDYHFQALNLKNARRKYGEKVLQVSF